MQFIYKFNAVPVRLVYMEWARIIKIFENLKREKGENFTIT